MLMACRHPCRSSSTAIRATTTPIAIVVAARHTELLGITTVAGNAPLSLTTRNALIMPRPARQIDTPVHSGAERPLVAPPRSAGHVHGESGLDGADLPEPTRPAASANAVEFIIETCRAREGTWLVPIGPITNIALALRAAPDLAGRLGGISLMGGGTFGNRTRCRRVQRLGRPRGRGHRVRLWRTAHHERSRPHPSAAGDPGAHQPSARHARHVSPRSSPTCSRSSVAPTSAATNTCVVRPCMTRAPCWHSPIRTCSERVERHVVVETQGEHTRGMTLIDQRDLAERPAPNCAVLTTVDADAAFAIILDAIASFA